MSSDSLKPLMFTVGLIDQITQPANNAARSFDNLTHTATTGFQDMQAGAVGLLGSGLMMYQSLAPAVEMSRAMNQLRSLDLPEKTVKSMGGEILEMSANYGIAASEITTASAAIGHSIKGLSEQEYMGMTEAVSLLSKTTQTSMEDASRYMTQMYHRFQSTADAMGKDQWAKRLAAQTAYLKNQLGADTTEIVDAMQGLNNLGGGLGVSMEEQLGVLATLGKSTGLTEAEQQYTNFLEYAVPAQEKLGMSFLDSTGKLLPMVDILKMLEAEFGNLEGAETWSILDDAFGDGAKLIQQLSKDTGGLAKTIDDLQNTTGIDKLMDQAELASDPWSKLFYGIQAVQIAMGEALLPAIVPLVDAMGSASREILSWTALFPNLTRLVGLLIVGILALGAGMAALTLAAGLGKAAWAGFLMIMKLTRVVTLAMTAAQWLMNAAFIASPVGLIVIGITALVAILYAAWQGIKALWDMFANSAAGEAFTEMIEGIVNWFKSLGGIVDWVIDKLNKIPGVEIGGTDQAASTPAIPKEADAYLPDNTLGLTPAVNPMPGIPYRPETTMADKTASYMPANQPVIEAPEVPAIYQTPELQPKVDVASLNIDVPYRNEGTANEVPAGGITNQISKSVSDNSNKTTHVAISTSQPVTPALVNEYLLMEGA